ncbi:hypothetical protein QTP70_019484, partial [Hemibagrus guttatus]
GIKAGYNLDGVPTHRRAHTHTHSLTQSRNHTTDNLEMPINLQCMSLDWARKPEYPEETPEAWGEHANSTHTHGGGGNRTPNPGVRNYPSILHLFITPPSSLHPPSIASPPVCG